jgi:hypothetical protein
MRPTAATRARDRLVDALAARNWVAMRAAFAADARVEDRRRLTRASWDIDASLAWMRGSAERSALHIERRLRSIFGERVSLEHQMWHGTVDGAPFEIEMLTLIEVDAGGRVTAIVNFDADDVSTAQREAIERWLALEPAVAPLLRTTIAYGEAMNARDLTRLRGLVADAIVLEDHRHSGIGLMHGADAYLQAMRVYFELIREVSSEVVVSLMIEPCGSIMLIRMTGALPDGGKFERLYCNIAIAAHGRFERLEFYEIDDVEIALTRFEELRRRAP